MATALRVVVVGGGTSGWMAASGLAKALKLTEQPGRYEVTLVESAEIGIVGVGEATLPHIKEFNDFLGINEADFMRKTQATFKLGIQFLDWGKKGNDYIHPFGAFGQPIAGAEFHNYWLKARADGFDPGSLEAYSYAITACREMRFDFPSEDKRSIKSTFSYAYHFDAGLYAPYLRGYAEALGVKRIEGMVVDVELDAGNGDIAAIQLKSGERIEGDLFIDCSGFRGLLISGALKAPWQDWTPWLPCDRAVAVPCDRAGDFTPFTRATARQAGWQWRIPLQHRTGNGYVYSSRFISDDEAAATLMANLDGAAQADPRPLRFAAGRRTASWTKNCVAIGLASGFLEPLESTSIYLAQVAITQLLQLLPDRKIETHLADEFNRLIDIEYDRVRDFLILHYYANSRDDGALWAYTRDMPIPDSLQHKIELFRSRAHIVKYKDGLFSPPSWLAVYMGQDLVPHAYSPMADSLSKDAVSDRLKALRSRIAAGVDTMPTHAEFIRDYCEAPDMTAKSDMGRKIEGVQ